VLNVAVTNSLHLAGASLRKSGLLTACLLTASFLAWTPELQAETIRDALGAAYSSNPTLRAERARQRATDEGVAQAYSGWRPTIIATGDLARVDTDTKGANNTTVNPYNVDVTLNQPIFRGFRTVNGIEQSEHEALAGQENLRDVEQTVFLEGVTAFMDVLRDARIVAFRRENVGILTEQLRGVQARRDVGELTETDVAQSRASLSQARSDLAAARSDLASSRADYVRVIGRSPGSLVYPKKILAKLPKTLDEAIALSEVNNPTILAAQYVERASKSAVDVEIGDLLPEVSAQAQVSHSNFIGRGNRSNTVSVIGVVSVPLYQAGQQHSEVRAAKQTNHQRRQEVLEAARSIKSQVVTAWNAWIAARQSKLAARDQVAANRTAYAGILEEAKVGSRTILDVLDTNQDLIDSRILLIGTQRDEIVAAYSLLATIGRLTAKDLGLDVALYDPNVNLDVVRRKFFGIGIGEPEPGSSE